MAKRQALSISFRVRGHDIVEKLLTYSHTLRLRGSLFSDCCI